MRNRASAFTLIELLVVISIIALLISILLPALGQARQVANQIKSGSQQRSIHLALVIYAQDNHGFYAGLDRDGREIENYEGTGRRSTDVELRYQALLKGGYTVSDVLIAPPDQDREPWDESLGQEVTLRNYSYGMQLLPIFGGDISQKHGMNQEWSETNNTQAVVIADRNIAAVSGYDMIQTIWTVEPGIWKGHVTWNDNHVTFEDDHRLSNTKHGNGPTLGNDLIFSNDSGSSWGNAFIVKFGNGSNRTYGTSDGVQ